MPPIAAAYTNGAWREGYSLAATDEARRLRAVEETTAALNLATLVPYQILVLHCGLPAPHGQPADNQVASMIRSLEQLSPVAAERRPILERAVKARARFEALLAFGDESPIETAVD